MDNNIYYVWPTVKDIDDVVNDMILGVLKDPNFYRKMQLTFKKRYNFRKKKNLKL